MIILSYGDGPKTSTGYGTVWENLLKRWIDAKPDWKFFHVSWQGRDRPHQTIEGYTILPIASKEYGVDTVEPYLLQINPDILLTLGDVGVQAGFIDGVFAARKKGWRGKWIAYSPIDTHTWEYVFWDKIFEIPDVNVAMANHGELMMKKHNVHDVKLIPHGVDTKKYKPLAEKTQLKASKGLEKKFVVGFVGRNQRRKMIANMMRGFSKFSKGKDDVCLLLHTDKEAVGGSLSGWSIPSLVAKYNAEEDPETVKHLKIKMTKEELNVITRQLIQPKSMNEHYNLMDVFCFATGGEGFGLPGIECQASGTPLMQTDHSTGFELTGEGQIGFLIPVLKDIYGRYVAEIGNNGVENVVPDDIEIAKILETLYLDWKNGGKLLKERSEMARKFALKYDWDLVAPLWLKLFEETA